MSYRTDLNAFTPELSLRLNEPSGTTAADDSGHSHTGTIVGSPTLGGIGLPGDSGGASIAFDGTGTQHVDIAALTGLPTTGDHTVIVWAKTNTGATNGGLFGFGDMAVDGHGFTLRTGATNTFVVDWGAGDLLIGTAPSAFDGDGTFHLFATTYEVATTTRKACFDGLPVNSDTPSASPNFDTSLTNGAIGSVFGNEMDGSITDAAVIDSLLSDADILALYTSGSTSIAPNPPTGLTATPNSGSGAIDLAWTAPGSGPTPDSYTVERSTSTNTETSYHTGVLTTSYSDTAVVVGTHYYYKILSRTTAGGDSTASAEANAVAPTRTVQLTDTIVNGALVPQAGITVTATLSVPGSATPVDGSGREIDLTPLSDVTDNAGTYLIDRASGSGVIAPQDIWQNSGGTLIPLPGCAWTISYLSTTIVSPEFAWSGTAIHPSSWVAPFETLGRFKMWLTDINGNGVVRPGVTFGCSLNANSTWTGGAGAGQLISSAGQFAVTTDSGGNIFLWVIRVSEFADAGRYYNLVELSGGSGGSATFVAPDTYTGDQGVYNGGTTYAAGAVVRRASDDVPFISQAGSNVGHALTDPTWWLVYNGEKVTLHTFLVGAPGTQVADTSMIAMADTTDAGDATAYAAPFTLAKQIKHIFYAIRHLLGAETLLSGKAAVIASPTSTQTGNIDMAGNITAAGELLSPLGLAAAHMAGYYATKAVTAAINANAGTGASVSHIEGGDSEGRITVVTGSGAWASGIQASVTFHTDYITATGVIVTLEPDDDATLAAWPTVRPRSIDGQVHKFDISFGVADTAAHTYKLKYHCHGE